LKASVPRWVTTRSSPTSTRGQAPAQLVWVSLRFRQVVCYSAVFTNQAGASSLVVEYVNGRSLAEKAVQYRFFLEPTVAAVTQQLVDGLAYLYTHCVIHQDV